MIKTILTNCGIDLSKEHFAQRKEIKKLLSYKIVYMTKRNAKIICENYSLKELPSLIEDDEDKDNLYMNLVDLGVDERCASHLTAYIKCQIFMRRWN